MPNTIEEAEQLIRSTDPEEVTKGAEMLESIANGETVEEASVDSQVEDNHSETPESVQEDSQNVEEVSNENSTPNAELTNDEINNVPDNAETAGMTEAEKQAYWKINYRGSEFELPDDDGFLGRKDLNGLKQATAHKEAHIKWQESEIEKTRARIAELEAKVLAPKEVPVKDVKPVASDDVKRPSRPIKPEVGVDPVYWTPEEEESMKKYQADTEQYHIDIDNYLGYLTEKVSTDPRFDKYDKLIEEREKEQQSRQAQLDEEAYWNNIEKFRNTHSELKQYRGTVQELHKDVHVWMTRLANASGFSLPLSPTQEDLQQFENTKLNLAERFDRGEQALIDLGVQPPTGYKEYYELGDLEKTRLDLIQQGIFGANSDLQAAFLYSKDISGELDKGISNVELEARKRGAQSVMSVMESNQANNANTIPNSENQHRDGVSDVNLSLEEKLQILQTPQSQLLTNPELKRKFDAIVASGEF